jgi:hypothetical protein
MKMNTGGPGIFGKNLSYPPGFSTVCIYDQSAIRDFYEHERSKFDFFYNTIIESGLPLTVTF